MSTDPATFHPAHAAAGSPVPPLPRALTVFLACVALALPVGVITSDSHAPAAKPAPAHHAHPPVGGRLRVQSPR